MKNFPGVIDEPKKPVELEKAAPQVPKPPSAPIVPDFEKFFAASFPHGFIPSGVVLRSGVDELLEGEVDDEQWEFIAGYVSTYVGNVLNPVLAALVRNASAHYVAQQTPVVTDEEILARIKEFMRNMNNEVEEDE